MRTVSINTNSNASQIVSTMKNAPKQSFALGNLRGFVEPAHAPFCLRLWVYLEDLNTMAEVWANTLEEGEEKLIAEINRKRVVVPVRVAAFARIETALKAKFAQNRLGYEFLNSKEKYWRNSPTERLIELAEIVEEIEVESPADAPTAAANKIVRLVDLSGECRLCGRPSYRGKTHLSCEFKADKLAA